MHIIFCFQMRVEEHWGGGGGGGTVMAGLLTRVFFWRNVAKYLSHLNFRVISNL